MNTPTHDVPNGYEAARRRRIRLGVIVAVVLLVVLAGLHVTGVVGPA